MKSNKPKNRKTAHLTICIPVYERTEFFDSCVQSVLNQTVTCEILVSDNASSHAFFKDRCKQLGIDYYRNETNLGVFANWNKCIQYANTPYAMILGDDDLISENFVEEFVNILEKYPHLDFHFSKTLLMSELGDTREYPWEHTISYGYFSDGIKYVQDAAYHDLNFPVLSTCFKREIFEDNYFITVPHGSNDRKWIYSNLCGRSVFGNRNSQYYYRKHGNQDTSVSSSKCEKFKMFFSDYFEMYVNLLTIDHPSLDEQIRHHISTKASYLLSKMSLCQEKFDIYLKNKQHRHYVNLICKRANRPFLAIFILSRYLRIIFRIFYRLREQLKTN